MAACAHGGKGMRLYHFGQFRKFEFASSCVVKLSKKIHFSIKFGYRCGLSNFFNAGQL